MSLGTAKQALQEARMALASGWTRGLSSRDGDGSIAWNLAGLIDRLANKHGLQLRGDIETEVIARGAASLEDFASSPGTSRADVLAAIDAVIGRQPAALKARPDGP